MSLSTVINTTIEKHIKKVERDTVIRKRKLLAALEKKGRISFNHGGTERTWRVQFKRATMNPLAFENGSTAFEDVDRYRTARLGWRSYIATDALHKAQELQNKGPEAIIKLITDKVERLLDDMRDQFPEELYIDGNASGNTNRLHGFESWCGNSSTISGGKVGNPSDTYAGHQTNLGLYGGSFTGTWPRGKGSAQYDWWSPLIVDYTNNNWVAGTKTWPNTNEEAMRFGLLNLARHKSTPNLILLDQEMYQQFVDSYSDKQRIKTDGGLMRELGFSPESTSFDGVDVTWEYGITSGIGYGIILDKLSLESMQGQLFVADKDWDIAARTKRFSLDFYGNLRIESPKFFLKFAALGGS